VLPSRITKDEALSNLEKIFSNGKFNVEPSQAKAKIGYGEKMQDEDVEIAIKNNIGYVYVPRLETLLVSDVRTDRPFCEAKSNTSVSQASCGQYNLLVIESSETREDGLLLSHEGIIGEIMNYRKDKNKLIGMRVFNNRIEIYATSTSGAGDVYFYKLTLLSLTRTESISTFLPYNSFSFI